MKRSIAFVFSLLLVMAGPALAQEAKPAQEAPKPAAEETPPLPRYLEVKPLIGTGAQPTEAGLRLLAEKGYKSIVNFRTAEEMAKIPYEEKLSGELGMKYFNIPVSGKEPKEAQALAFLQLMDSLKDEKVFVHCTAANRAGALMMIQMALQGGMDPQKAEAEAIKIGMYSENLRLFAREVIEKHKKK